jgi:hypothetical protein
VPGFLLPGENMSAGTLALTNGSTAVGGTGTSFTTELKAGDFVYVTIGGTPYTLVVSAISSDTSLAISVAFSGPTTSGVAWNAVPASIQVAITQKILNDFATVARGMILEKANWQQIYTGTGNVTITLPDGTTYTGPAWNGITTTLAGKAAKGANSDITSLTGLTTALSIAQGGTGTTTAAAAWTALLNGRTVASARGDLGLSTTSAPFFAAMELSSGTPYIDFHYASTASDYSVRLINDGAAKLSLTAGQFDSSGGYTSRIGTNGGIDTAVPWNFFWNYNNAVQLGMFVGTGFIGYVTTNSASDKGWKKDISYLSEVSDKASSDALNEVLQWKVATFKYKARGIIPESAEKLGFIANDLVNTSPACVTGEGLPDDYDIEADPNNPNAYNLDQIAIIAKLTQAIQAQQQLITSQSEAVTDLQERIAALAGAGS